ncbi:MAG TPA: acyl carrier protein [Candidatus Omnitrophota bacterium]|nr:acyl carrier protein [Candidatus Omnitrophota bacterium]
MEEKIRKILSIVLEVPEDEINEGATPYTVENWDSLNHLKLITAIEEEFGVKLTDQDVLEMQSFKLIKSILSNKDVR